MAGSRRLLAGGIRGRPALGAAGVPELSQPLPPPRSLPEQFEKTFDDIGIARIRRGPLSATLVLGGSSRFFTLRYGDAVMEGVRFATSLFGKGNSSHKPRAGASAYEFRQSLEGPYYQPLRQRSPRRHGKRAGDDEARARCAGSEQSADVTETERIQPSAARQRHQRCSRRG